LFGFRPSLSGSGSGGRDPDRERRHEGNLALEAHRFLLVGPGFASPRLYEHVVALALRGLARYATSEFLGA
jgi:hypothetical protein